VDRDIVPANIVQKRAGTIHIWHDGISHGASFQPVSIAM
jgi:hypothetical protein